MLKDLTEALGILRHGGTLACVTPEGRHFQIQSKLSFGIPWYRVRPARRGCLNQYSRLDDSEMLQWLSQQSEVSVVK